ADGRREPQGQRRPLRPALRPRRPAHLAARARRAPPPGPGPGRSRADGGHAVIAAPAARETAPAGEDRCAGRRSDRALDAALVAFAVWTVASHVGVVLRAPAWAAAVIWVAGCAVIARSWRPAASSPPAPRPGSRAARRRVVVAGGLAAAGGA